MRTLIREVRSAILATLLLGIVGCGGYPLLVWLIARALYPWEAQGSLLRDEGGTVYGSRWIGQGFSADRYFHSRPSAAGVEGYDASASGGSNLGPTSAALREQIRSRIAAYRLREGMMEGEPVPADAVTASASGLDPHISPANAALQAARVARVRGLEIGEVRRLIAEHTEGRDLGFLGEPRVHVLSLNRALDGVRMKAGAVVGGAPALGGWGGRSER